MRPVVVSSLVWGVVLALSTAANAPAAADDRRVLEVHGGLKWMSSDWEEGDVDLSTPVEIGIRWVSPLVTGPIGLEGGYSYAWAREEISNVELKSDISRLHVGLRYGFPGRWILLHAVGGLQWVEAALEADVDRTGEVVRDSAVGAYTGAGARVPVTDALRVGVDARFSWVSLDMEGEDRDGSGAHLSFVLGLAW